MPKPPIYAVGKRFPRPNPHPGTERAEALTNPAFFDVLFYSQSAKADAAFWKTGTVRAYFYAHDGSLPFLVLLFVEPRLTLEVTLNALLLPADVREDWFKSPADVVSLYLIDATTNKLAQHRIIRAGWAAALRLACQRQAATFAAAAEVEASLTRARAEQNLTAAEIIRRALTP